MQNFGRSNPAIETSSRSSFAFCSTTSNGSQTNEPPQNSKPASGGPLWPTRVTAATYDQGDIHDFPASLLTRPCGCRKKTRPHRSQLPFISIAQRVRSASRRGRRKIKWDVHNFAASLRGRPGKRYNTITMPARGKVMKRADVLRKLRAERDNLRERYGVESLALFGSVARDEAGPGSDVDVLVEFGRPITLFDLVAVQQYLERCLGVRRVDLVPRDSVYPAFRDEILREALHVG